MGNNRWKSFRAEYLETDLWIAVNEAGYKTIIEQFVYERTKFYRKLLDDHIRACPAFATSLIPIDNPGGIPNIINEMYLAAEKSETGPMSSVAGAMAEYICKDLFNEFQISEAVIENGGDIFMKLTSPVTVSVYAGKSPLSEKIGLIIKPEETPVSVCCSSGTVGHSLSFGLADACMIACSSGALADAYATSFCNKVKSSAMVGEVTEQALNEEDVLSAVIICNDIVGLGGKLELKVFGQ